ncbi:MAG: hypothetical protein LBB04_02130 [Oscillospiraceae bacterium]|jgi:hypothetical protein|nr:hypothetical protein [Oscillospiraceae bacterium]
MDMQTRTREQRGSRNKRVGTKGTKSAPFLIRLPEDFLMISRYPCAWYRLEEDLDMSPIALVMGSKARFGGTFDGNGKCIYNLKIRDANSVSVGLFGTIEVGATVRNLKVKNVSVIGAGCVGVIAGENNGEIVNCELSDVLVQGFFDVGGLVGSNRCWAKIQGCAVDGAVLGNANVGGIVGNNLVGAKIIKCFSDGKLCGLENVGGVAGQNHGEIASSSSNSKMKSQKIAGKLVGLNWGKVKLEGDKFLQKHYDKVLIFSEFIGRNLRVFGRS